MLSLSQLLLLFLSLGVAIQTRAQISRQRQFSSEYLVLSLSAGAFALALAGELLLSDKNADSATLQRLLTNLALYAAAPMLVSALLALTKGSSVSRQGWGRWLLALIALFELCRRMGFGEMYTLILGISCALGLALSVLGFRSTARITQGVAALSLASAVATEHFFGDRTSTLLLCALALSMLAASIKLFSPAGAKTQ